MIVRALLAAFLFLAPMQSAYAGGEEEFATPDPAQPAVGEWIGNVSWNETRYVTYGWSIYADGTFGSGRLGRGQDGAAGTWGVRGAHLVLKYTSGFRYEGELGDDTYAGQAFAADGSVFGTFSMSRARKSSVIEESP